MPVRASSTARAFVVVGALGVAAMTACGGSGSGVASSAAPTTAADTSGPDTTNLAVPPTEPPTTASTAAPTTTRSSTAPPHPPSTTTSAPVSEASLAGRVVVIDPGHNEHNASHPAEINQLVDVGNGTKACDTTGTATNSGYSEARFTTDVAAQVGQRLRAVGATVVLTRDAATPWGPCITERAAIGNRAQADVALSIHADGGPSSGHGFHVIRPGLVAGHNDGIIGASSAFATVLHDRFAAESGLSPATYVGSGGYDTRTDLGGLNLSTVPKVFIECANMRNAGDAAVIESAAGRARIAAAISDAIIRYLEGGR